MTEKKMRKKLLQILEPIGAHPVENILVPGMPDVVCPIGWLELKVAERPLRPTSRVVVDLRPAQRLWLKRWRQHGGRAWTLTLLGDLWILHDALWAVDQLGETTEDEMIAESAGCWKNAPSFEQLMGKLMNQSAVN